MNSLDTLSGGELSTGVTPSPRNLFDTFAALYSTKKQVVYPIPTSSSSSSPHSPPHHLIPHSSFSSSLPSSSTLTLPKIEPPNPCSPHPNTPFDDAPVPRQTGIYQFCAVCGDTVSIHIKILICSACRSFFNRSMRNNRVYLCSTSTQNCVINKDNRKTCQYCRLKKCFSIGMKAKVRCHRHRSYNKQIDFSGLSISTLLNTEMNESQLSLQRYDTNYANKKIATLDNICESMKQQLLKIIEWTKCLPEFCQVPVDDQMALLRAGASNLLLLGVVFRSLDINNILLLGNNYIIPRVYPNAGQLVSRIMDELIMPLRKLQIDAAEFTCLNAIILFDPAVKKLTNIDKVNTLRYQIQINLEDYMNNNQHKPRGRFGELLLILPTLQNIAMKMIEQVQVAKLCKVVKIDDLLQEMLLRDDVDYF